MDIHKPKAAHSLREFLIEIGTIICGILIALGLEQLVEQLHILHDMEAMRSALESEARDTLAGIRYRQQLQPCIDRRFAEIATIFARHHAGKPLGLSSPVGKLPLYLGSTGTWQIALSSKALANMPLADKLRYSDAFDSYTSFSDRIEEENRAWRKLELLDQASILNDQDWSVLHQAYAEARSMDKRIKISAAYILRDTSLGQTPAALRLTPEVVEAKKTFCTPVLAPGSNGASS